MLKYYDTLFDHSFNIWFSYIYSGHCKALAPEYEKAAEELAKNDPPLYVAKVDATEQKKLGERFGVQGFPTLKWFV